MTIYSEDDCPPTFIRPMKLNCCVCGQFSGLVCTYPEAFLYYFVHACYVCETGYGCKSTCNCVEPEVEQEPNCRSFSSDGIETCEYKCNKIL